MIKIYIDFEFSCEIKQSLYILVKCYGLHFQFFNKNKNALIKNKHHLKIFSLNLIGYNICSHLPLMAQWFYFIEFIDARLFSFSVLPNHFLTLYLSN